MSLSTRVDGYLHTQSSASLTWTIVHNLGTVSPVIDAWTDDGFGNTVKILPSSVVATDANTVTLTFSTVRSGQAMVV